MTANTDQAKPADRRKPSRPDVDAEGSRPRPDLFVTDWGLPPSEADLRSVEGPTATFEPALATTEIEGDE